jgi:hypothetical protein
MMRNAVAAITAAAVLALAAADAAAGPPQMITSRPEGTDEVVFNPGMGLAFCSWSAPPQWMRGETCWVDEVSNHVYIRVMWKDVNPEPGVFTIEESELGRWIAAIREHGGRYSLRIMPNCLSSPEVEDVAPTWIYDTGVRYVMVDTSHGGQKFPVPWGEPYLAAMEGIVAELGKRYDGDPALEYVDVPVGSFGEIWFFGDYDEWVKQGYSTDRVIDATKDLIDLYRRHFPRSRLAIPLGEGHFQGERNRDRIRDQVLDYCARTGVMPRQDGIWTDEHWLAQRFREMSPRIGTMWEPVRGILENPGDSAQIYARALEGAPSYFNWYGIRSDQMQSERERERLRDFARKLGYRLTVASVEYPASVRVGLNRPSQLEAKLVWRNDGVAYCHEDVQMRIAALDAGGKVVCETRSWPRHPVNTWAPGAEVEEPVVFKLPPDCPARVQLAVGLTTRGGRPITVALKERRSDGLCPIAWIDVDVSHFEPVVLWQQAGSDEWRLSEGMKMEEVADGGPDGGRCLRLSGDDPSDSWNFARLPDLEAQPGGKYVLSGSIRVDRAGEGSPAYVKIDCNDGEGRQISHVEGGQPTRERAPDGSFGWTRFKLETVAPPGTRSLSIAVEKGRPAPNLTDCRLAGLKVELVEMP